MSELGISVLLHEDEHRAPVGHPESSERLLLVEEALYHANLSVTWKALKSQPATDEMLRAVHNPEFLRQLRDLASAGGGYFDADTYVTPASYQAASRVCGALCAAVVSSCAGAPAQSIILGRPPGHHAESTRAMGFCLINHVAVAAAYARESNLAERVSIFDFDLHHGNGTQEIFYERADVQYISCHQSPFYPGTGAATERGACEGKGFTVNVPLSAGAGDVELLGALDTVIIPAIESYKPQVIIVSAGFDGHYADPLGDLRFTPEGFEGVGRRLARVSEQVCQGRLVTFVEGGYNAEANQESAIHYVKGLVTR